LHRLFYLESLEIVGLKYLFKLQMNIK
jgi:hypothetical protein